MCTWRLGHNFNVVPQFFETGSRNCQERQAVWTMIPKDSPVFIFQTLRFQAQDTLCLFEFRGLSLGTHPCTASFALTSCLCRLPLQFRGFLPWPIWFQNIQQQSSSFLKTVFNFLILHKWCLLSSDQDLPVSSSPWTSPILFYTCTHSAPLQYSTRKWGHAAFVSVCLTSLSLKASRFTDAITSSKPSSFKTESHSLYKYTYHSSSVCLLF